MKIKRILILSVTAMIVLSAALYLLRFRKEGFAGLKGKRDLNCILITVDTLRADKIGCYGFSRIETPVMDMFASRGVKFDRCISQTPLTLPSHTTIMTGTYPVFHGVRDNGGFLVPQELSTLAELFKQKNYQTGAFVAAYVVDSKWGLNQGFDTYFDNFDLSKYKTISLGNVQRRGDEVIDEVLGWLEGCREDKFFAWVHLYDPHTPYEPPSPYKEQYPHNPYLGEIAYTDSQLGRLWSYLEENNLIENTVIVFASDHGESLGEHKESAHGFFIYQEGVHVPLIFVTPFKKLHGITRTNVVTLADIMPTILKMNDISLPGQIQGENLLPLFFKEKGLENNFAYSETYYPRFHYGWSELKSIQDEKFKLIVAPELELYDLINDPDEENNIVNIQAKEARRLKAVIDGFIEEWGRDAFQVDYRSIDEETRQKLTALGYIGTFTDSSSLEGRKLGDPKEKIVIFNRLSKARELGLEGEFERAVKMMNGIIEEDPDVIDAYFSLGNLYYKNNKFEESLECFFKVLERKPNDAFTVINIANSYMMMGNIDEAERFVLGVINFIPPDSQINFILGNIYNAQKEYEEAVKYYKECLRLNPSSPSAYSALGGVYIVQGNLDEGEKYLEKAVELNPKLRNLHYNLAQLFEERGNFERTIEEYKKELDNIPHNFKASFNLSRIFRILKREEEEIKWLDKTIEINPNFPLSYFYLARIYLNQGQRFREAISLIKKGIELKPEKKELPLGYFLLADIYNRLGDNDKSLEYAQKGENARTVSEKH